MFIPIPVLIGIIVALVFWAAAWEKETPTYYEYDPKQHDYVPRYDSGAADLYLP